MHKVLIGILLLAPLAFIPAAPAASFVPLANASAVISVGAVAVAFIGGGTLVVRTQIRQRRKDGR